MGETRKQFLLLERLGIPRVRFLGLSVFNFVGTFFLTYALTAWTRLGYEFTWFSLSCLSIPAAVAVHALLQESTPLVQLARRSLLVRLLLVLLLVLGAPASWKKQLVRLGDWDFLVMTD